MNDLLIAAGVVIPLIHRGEIGARSLSLGGVRHNGLGRDPVEHSRVASRQVR